MAKRKQDWNHLSRAIMSLNCFLYLPTCSSNRFSWIQMILSAQKISWLCTQSTEVVSPNWYCPLAWLLLVSLTILSDQVFASVQLCEQGDSWGSVLFLQCTEAVAWKRQRRWSCWGSLSCHKWICLAISSESLLVWNRCPSGWGSQIDGFLVPHDLVL